jgi:DNA-binding CsgD family transcriptional regulator
MNGKRVRFKPSAVVHAIDIQVRSCGPAGPPRKPRHSASGRLGIVGVAFDFPSISSSGGSAHGNAQNAAPTEDGAAACVAMETWGGGVRSWVLARFSGLDPTPNRLGSGLRSAPRWLSGEHLLCGPARRAERGIFDNGLDFATKQTVFGGVSVFSRTLLLRSMSMEGLEGKGYRTPLSPAGESTRIVLACKEREMIRMIADGASLRLIAQQLELGEIQLRADLDSVFAKLAMLGRLELLSRKTR